MSPCRRPRQQPGPNQRPAGRPPTSSARSQYLSPDGMDRILDGGGDRAPDQAAWSGDRRCSRGRLCVPPAARDVLYGRRAGAAGHRRGCGRGPRPCRIPAPKRRSCSSSSSKPQMRVQRASRLAVHTSSMRGHLYKHCRFWRAAQFN